jgi:hypothetical protein
MWRGRRSNLSRDVLPILSLAVIVSFNVSAIPIIRIQVWALEVDRIADSPKSWSVDAKTIDKVTFDLSVKNPNGVEEIAHRSPEEIMDEIAALDAESAVVLADIRALL